MRVVSINIGTNLGDRKGNLRRAVAAVERLSGKPPRISDIYESESWGYRSDNPFYNIAVEFESDLSGEELLRAFQQIEREIGSASHRDESGGYADRLLDIDIIYLGEEIVKTDKLQVPHPHMEEREFVLAPLAELSPRWRHPRLGQTVEEMLSSLRRRLYENETKLNNEQFML